MEGQVTFDAACTALTGGATLATANNRLARHLARRHADGQIRAGKVAWETPDILPLGAWLQRSYETLAACGHARERLLNPHQQRLVWEQQVSASAAAEGLLRPDSTARLAAEAWERLCAWNLQIDDINPGASEETRAFLGWARGFLRDCRDNDWIDPARLPATVSAAVARGVLPLPEAIIFAGFEAVPPAIESLAATLDEHGCRVYELLPPHADARQTRLALADSATELTTAAGWAVQRLRDHPEARLGIIVPDLAQRRAGVIRILDTVLHPEAGTTHSVPPQRLYNLSLGDPLTEAPVVNDALLALRLLVSGVEFSEVSTLLRSPFLGEGESEFLPRSALDSNLREGPDRRVTTHQLLRAAGNRCPALSRRLIKATKLLDERSASPSAWSVRFRSALSALGWPGERGANSAEYQQAQRFRDLVDQFPSLDAVISAMDARRALANLSGMARQTTFQPESRSTGSIQVMGLLEADGQSFDGLWITGLSDQQFPPPGEPHPLLPVTLQRLHRMPHASADHDLEFARRLLERLRAAAPEVAVSWPGRDNDRELMPSPLILGIREGSPDAVGSLVLEKPADRWLGTQPLTAVEDMSGPPVAEGAHVHGGTRLLADQAACPFRAYARHRLLADSPGDPEPDPSPLTRGSLLHATLEAFWRAVGDQQTLLACDDDTLDRYVSEAVDAGLAEDGRDLTDASRDLERNRLRRRLAAWLHVERQRAPFSVVATEDRRDVTVGGLELTTQIDRLDRLADGRHVVIDYKSGNARRDGWFGDRLFEPQLPLYAVCATEEAIAAVTFARLKPGDLRFVGTAEDNALMPGVKALARDAKRGGIDSWQELLAQWRTRLGQLAAEVRQGLAVVAPQKNDACAYCGLDDLCRIATVEDEQPRENGSGADR